MFFERLFIWPMLVISYAALSVASVHVFFGGWSAFATLALLFAIFIGAPSLLGYVGYLGRKNRLRGSVRYEAAACAFMPMALLLLAFFIIHLGRLRDVFP